MNCKNCLSPNPAGVTHCQTCRMPGDFGQALVQEATVVAAKLVSCSNCGGHAPAQAANCPACRWPIAKADRITDARQSQDELRLRKAI